MRISDWSSDVCSSDLQAIADGLPAVADIGKHEILQQARHGRGVEGGARHHGMVAAATQPVVVEGSQVRMRNPAAKGRLNAFGSVQQPTPTWGSRAQRPRPDVSDCIRICSGLSGRPWPPLPPTAFTHLMQESFALAKLKLSSRHSLPGPI